MCRARQDQWPLGRHGLRVPMICALVAALTVQAAQGESTSVVEKRQRLLDAAVKGGASANEQLMEALDDQRRSVRWTAAQLLGRMKRATRQAIDTALAHEDVQVRRIVIDGLASSKRLAPYWSTILLDEDPLIQRRLRFDWLPAHGLPDGEARDHLFEQLAHEYAEGTMARRIQILSAFTQFDQVTATGRRLLVEATRSEAPNVREKAFKALTTLAEPGWPEARRLIERGLADESKPVREQSHALRWALIEVERLQLPTDGWRFKTDPGDRGRAQQWYAPRHDDSGWRTDVPIETSWQQHMPSGTYIGAAWYRRSIQVPDTPEWDAASLQFKGVDEQAWVWVNGNFVGEHAIGWEGWNMPFVLDVTGAMKPGTTNQITVRAQNTGGHGGIWQPVYLHLLDRSRLNDDN